MDDRARDERRAFESMCRDLWTLAEADIREGRALAPKRGLAAMKTTCVNCGKASCGIPNLYRATSWEVCTACASARELPRRARRMCEDRWGGTSPEEAIAAMKSLAGKLAERGAVRRRQATPEAHAALSAAGYRVEAEDSTQGLPDLPSEALNDPGPLPTPTPEPEKAPGASEALSDDWDPEAYGDSPEWEDCPF